MSYRILDLDVTHRFPTVTLSLQEVGIALVIRRMGKPIGFLMRSLPPLSQVSQEQISSWVAQECGIHIIQSAIQESLAIEAKDKFPLETSRKLPSVTIAICTKDRPDWIVRCVHSLLSLQLPKGSLEDYLNCKANNHEVSPEPEVNTTNVTVEILVIDNAPSDPTTQARITAIPGIRYVQEPKAGLNFARNRAIEEATGDLLGRVLKPKAKAGWKQE